MKAPVKESPLHRQMLEYFVELGEKRSLTLVAKRYHKTKGAISVIAKAFNWQEKAQERDQKVADAVAEDFDKQLAEAKIRKLKLIRALDAKLAQRLTSGQQFNVTTSDFVSAAKLELLLLGEATERTEEMTVVGIVQRAAQSARQSNIPPKD